MNDETFSTWLESDWPETFDASMEAILRGQTLKLNPILQPFISGGEENNESPSDIKKVRREFVKYVQTNTEASEVAYSILLLEKKDDPEDGMAGNVSRGGNITINPKYFGGTADKETGKMSGTSYKNAVRDSLTKYKGLSKFPESVKREVIDLFYDYARNSSEGIKIAFGDIASTDTIIQDTLKPILVNLLFEGKGITANKVLKVTKLPIKKLTLSDVGRDNYLQGQTKLNAHISQLEDLTSNYSHLKTRLSTIIRKLKSINVSGQEDIRKVSVDMLVGSLSLKSLDRREKIYTYWETKHQEFEKYISSQDDFIEAYEKYLSTERVSEENMPSILQRVAQLKENRLTNEDNYIVKVPKQTLDRDDKSIEAILLLGDFLKGYLKDEDTFQSVEMETAGAVQSDYDQMDVRIEAEFAEQSTKTQTDLATREAFGNNVETALFHDIESFKSLKEVDPLFSYVWKQGAFNRVPAFKKDIDSLKRRAKKYATKIEVDLDDSALGKLEDYIDDLEEYATEEKVDDFYYLPLTTKLADEFNLDNKESLTKKLLEHFDIMYDILNLGTGSEKAAMPTGAKTNVGRTGKNDSTKPIEQTYSSLFTGRKGTKLKEVLTIIETEYDDYVDALIDYVIRPLLSENMPFDDEPEYVTNKVMDFFMSQEGKEPTAFTTLLARYAEMGTATLSVKGLTRLTELLEAIGNIEPGSRLSGIKSAMELAAKQLDLIFETQHTRDIDVEFGAALQEIKEKNNLDIDVEFNGTPVETLAKEFASSDNKLYPLAVLVKHIRKRKGDYQGDALLNPRAKDSGLASAGYNATSEGKSDAKNLVSSFIQAYDNLTTKGLIVKSNFEINLLETHDSIRKMLNKPVYYGVSKLDNFTHINNAIEKVNSIHKIELSANDVEAIVSELDSMESIAKKHGVSQDTVYYLKGNFR